MSEKKLSLLQTWGSAETATFDPFAPVDFTLFHVVDFVDGEMRTVPLSELMKGQSHD